MKKLFTIKGIIAAVAVMFALSLTSCKKDGKGGEDEGVVKVTGIKFTKSEITIAVNKITTLEYTITPSNATNKEVTFTSDKESVAKVDASGVVKGISKGEATITAKAKDGSGKQATCKVTVVDKGGSDEGGENGGDQKILVETITIEQTTKELYVGDTFQLDVTVLPANATDKTLTWTSSSDNVTVDLSGKITAVKEGNATITATAKDGSGTKATCEVTVQTKVINVESITITPSTKELSVGDTFQLDVTVLPANATDTTLTWTSSNDNVTVDSLGKITAVKEGSAIITATAKDGSGVKATCTVNCYKSEYTQSDYYMWDAYKPYENITSGTWGEGSSWYNPTKDKSASASCKDCPTAQQMVAYLKAGVYWDDNTKVAEGKKTYTLDGKTTEYQKGLWVKKRRYIENFDSETDTTYLTTPKRLSTLGNEEVIKIRTNGEYFFLPACGCYNNNNSGSFINAGAVGYYWSSTPNATSPLLAFAYYLFFNSGEARVHYYLHGIYGRRDLGFVPMSLL